MELSVVTVLRLVPFALACATYGRWEAPGWFANLEAGQPAELDPLGWGRHHWFDNWAAEHRACREVRGAALQSIIQVLPKLESAGSIFVSWG